jgi:hypothetical protein
MPDKRTHRGPHPQDTQLFHPDRWPALQAATADLSWLLTRGYAWKSATKLVGDRHGLTERQRTAVWRSSCSDPSLAQRQSRLLAIEAVRGRRLAIDGYNLLVTLESALGRGVILAGRDACYRDLASMHGTYRKVAETVPAIQRVGDALAALKAASVCWYLDSPVSNSGRLRGLLLQAADQRGWPWEVLLEHNPDTSLAAASCPVASTDSWVLDHCSQWVNLAHVVIQERIPDANIVPIGID